MGILTPPALAHLLKKLTDDVILLNGNCPKSKLKLTQYLKNECGNKGTILKGGGLLMICSSVW